MHACMHACIHTYIRTYRYINTTYIRTYTHLPDVYVDTLGRANRTIRKHKVLLELLRGVTLAEIDEGMATIAFTVAQAGEQFV